ncbi:DMT family transporter [Aureimonas fodinaquatilis]|nr:DMT family transporter [Aureimonas fodinaquatilis]
MPAHPSPSPSNRSLAGIGFMLLGTFMFASNDALGKYLISSYSIGQILLVRSVVALLLIAPFIYKNRAAVFRPQRPGMHLLRVICSTAEVALFYAALYHLPLADVMTFYLAGPIYVTALSALILREQVGWRRWLAVMVGFVGVLIALGPSLGTASLGAMLAVGGSFAYALLIISTRSLSGSGGTTLITWQTVAALVFGIFVAPFSWAPVDMTGFAALALLGAVSMLAHVFINQSLKIAEASTVVPFQYTLIVWALVYGVLFFGDQPQASLLMGAGLIVLSGLFIFLREQKRGKISTATVVPDVAPIQPDRPADRR